MRRIIKSVNSQLGGDAAAIGPFLVSHLGLPTWLVILYVIVILSACYSVIDSAFTVFAATAGWTCSRRLRS